MSSDISNDHQTVPLESESHTTLPQRGFLGTQPIVAVAKFKSSDGRNWHMLFHDVAQIYVPTSAANYFQDDFDGIDCSDWPAVDYDYEIINRNFMQELDNDGCQFIKWAYICGMQSDEGDPFHYLRAHDSVTDENNKLIDNYWEIQILTRDDPDFWSYMLTDYSGTIGIDWAPNQQPFSKCVLDWARENPHEAQFWLVADPLPMTHVDSDEANANVNELLKRIRHAIRQGLLLTD